MLKQIMLLSCVAASAAGQAQAARAVEFRLTVRCDAKGASQPLHVEGDLHTFCLSPQVLADERDVESAEVDPKKKPPAVSVVLTKGAAKRMLETTRLNIGNRLGVVMTGRLLAAPMIVAPLSSPLAITRRFTGQDANELARALNHQR